MTAGWVTQLHFCSGGQHSILSGNRISGKSIWIPLPYLKVVCKHVDHAKLFTLASIAASFSCFSFISIPNGVNTQEVHLDTCPMMDYFSSSGKRGDTIPEVSMLLISSRKPKRMEQSILIGVTMDSKTRTSLLHYTTLPIFRLPPSCATWPSVKRKTTCVKEQSSLRCVK